MIHVEGDVNPVRDLDIISEELRLKDVETLSKNLEKLERTVCRGGDKKLKPEYVSIVFKFCGISTLSAERYVYNFCQKIFIFLHMIFMVLHKIFMVRFTIYYSLPTYL